MKTWYKGDGAMIRFTWYELLWLFFIYSFLGWVLETAAATVKQKKFANRGLVNGPFCVIYGIAALFIWITGAKRSLAFFICDDLCDSDRMGCRPFDREGV
jgi:hypothetical protein